MDLIKLIDQNVECVATTNGKYLNRSQVFEVVEKFTSTNTHIAQALREIAADMEGACGDCPADLVADVHYKARIKGWARQLRNVL